MKRIKKYRIILITTAVAAAAACSKSFLNIPPAGFLQPNTVATKAGVEALLVGAYSLLDGIGGAGGNNGPWATAASNWVYGSVAGGDAHKGSDPGDQNLITPIETWGVNASNAYLDDVWQARYDGVQRANEAIRIMRLATDLLPADTIQVTAEAKFLRAHYHFELRKLFGKVPYIDENVTYSAGNFLIPNDHDILPDIEADLNYAYTNLPETQSDLGRANKWAAACYLMKVYIFEGRFSDAKTLFDSQIKPNGKTTAGHAYKLNARFSDNFNPSTRNSDESVFAAQMTVNDGASGANSNQGDGLNFPYGGQTGCCGFFQPSFSLANSFKVDANGLPFLDGSYNNTNLKNDQGINSNTPYTPDAVTPIDPRIDWTIGRRGIPFLDWGPMAGANWVRNQASAGPYEPVKNMFYAATKNVLTDASGWTAGFTANNVNIIRYADVLLWAAEAEIQAGSLDAARGYINQVRDRNSDPSTWVHKYLDDTNPTGGYSNTPAANYKIGLYTTPFASKDAALTALYFERKLELAMEGQRFFDLSRWGIAKQELDPFYAHEVASGYVLDVGASFTTGKNEFLPIPQPQIDKSTTGGKSVLTQNPGY
ncbi:MAG: RagB/SusD family nutrient uptake outer membrane protein [Bacteroidetes bacterium]|nr:RagB/SusD family nutrient uptake outer membrane protein [Bacteroidota bacterium]